MYVNFLPCREDQCLTRSLTSVTIKRIHCFIRAKKSQLIACDVFVRAKPKGQ